MDKMECIINFDEYIYIYISALNCWSTWVCSLHAKSHHPKSLAEHSDAKCASCRFDSVFKTKQQTSNSSTAHANSNIKSLCNCIRRYSKKCRTQTKRNNQKRRTQRKQLRPISWTQAKRNKIHQKKASKPPFRIAFTMR